MGWPGFVWDFALALSETNSGVKEKDGSAVLIHYNKAHTIKKNGLSRYSFTKPFFMRLSVLFQTLRFSSLFPFKKLPDACQSLALDP